MAKRRLPRSVPCLSAFVVLASLATAPVTTAAEVPELAIQHIAAIASGPALPRLTTVIPVDPSDAAHSGLIHINLTGLVTNAENLPFHAELRIMPGPSVWVDDTVFNTIRHVEGSFEFGETGSQRAWEVLGLREGVWFPKTFFKDRDLRIVLPLAFSRAGDSGVSALPGQPQPAATVRAILLVRCAVESQSLACATTKFVFGDALNEPNEPTGSVSELVPVKR